jgi:hypothetical protein
MSPRTKTKDSNAAPVASRFPIEEALARPMRVSNESLAKPAVVHERTEDSSSVRAAATVPSPMTRSRTPMVLMSKVDAPVGCSRPEIRMGTLGAAISATPTAVRSHPIDSCRETPMGRSVLKYPAQGGPSARGPDQLALGDVFDPHCAVLYAMIVCPALENVGLLVRASSVFSNWEALLAFFTAFTICGSSLMSC